LFQYYFANHGEEHDDDIGIYDFEHPVVYGQLK
jgi:hypothetical protein